ncbi:MAG: hypothetical protein IKH99_07495 [Prevotella sp.]|nr:hypothetical protein [Prevotella sp.]
MKKLFTLIALLTCFLGVQAVEKVDAEVDFSKYSDISEWNFPYSWGGSDQAKARLSIKDGCLHFESTEVTLNENGEETGWLCQFFPIGGVNAEVGTVYTLHFKIKGDHAENVSMLGFGQTPYGQFPITTEWVEGTVDYEATNNDGNILMQCGSYIGSWDIAYLKITHEERANQRPKEWVPLLQNGNAEQPWGDLANVAFNDQENNYKICAWSKEKGHNMNNDGGWDPFPAGIEEVDGSHVFVVHGQVADTEGDPSAWDNQFWIQGPRRFKPGEKVKVHFRYKASEAATTNTQIHHQNPSDYMHWQAIGDINFTTEWQEYDQEISWPSGGDDLGWSIAFNLNPQNKNAIDFYFDDLAIDELKLDHGYFAAYANAAAGIEYNFDEAIQFEDGGDGTMIVTVGEAGKPETWVSEIMISTVRGDDGSFKAATLKPSTGAIEAGDDFWYDYAEGSNAKIKLPAAGVWQITLDTEFKSINFIQIEGDTPQGPIEIKANPTEIVVKAPERDILTNDGGTGQPWDSQFWIVANRTLEKGEATILSFKYKASKEAKTSTQCHADPGAYLHWAAIGDVNFTEDWQEFSATFTVPNEADGMKSIAFNMAEIQEANNYEIKDVVWKTEDGTESLINQTGKQNFYVKEGATDSPHVFDDGTGIKGVYTNGNATSGATYNIAGQRVSKDFKGIVIENGKKIVVK